jgi:hypothetical protein
MWRGLTNPWNLDSWSGRGAERGKESSKYSLLYDASTTICRRGIFEVPKYEIDDVCVIWHRNTIEGHCLHARRSGRSAKGPRIAESDQINDMWEPLRGSGNYAARGQIAVGFEWHSIGNNGDMLMRWAYFRSIFASAEPTIGGNLFYIRVQMDSWCEPTFAEKLGLCFQGLGFQGSGWRV